MSSPSVAGSIRSVVYIDIGYIILLYVLYIFLKPIIATNVTVSQAKLRCLIEASLDLNIYYISIAIISGKSKSVDHSVSIYSIYFIFILKRSNIIIFVIDDKIIWNC